MVKLLKILIEQMCIMKISDIRIKLINTDGALKGLASITLEDSFAVHGIRIFQKTDELYIVMPGKKASDGTYKDIVHPVNRETRAAVTAAVLKAYDAAKIAAEAICGPEK